MPKVKTNRAEILRAVWKVFHEKGYHDASLQQLATAAGLGKAGLLHHFGSKADLMKAALEYAMEWYETRVLTQLQGDAPAAERLGAFMDCHFRLCELNGGAGCFFANTILETGGNGLFAAGLTHFHNRWKEVTQAFLQERFPEAEAAERTYRLFADYQGSVILYKLYQDTSHLERFRARALESLNLPIYPK
ncbi:TetR/AcrR family transcriptional regulator [Lewinella sp. 4G2]|uniref:TetR/AcrR family transcriptional regulator n=1 Tax=Lewinella sp. 4G2 TaxID=1803372 RepID=UPI0007B4E4E6|nr:TetR/AcrR family transcriptional regulator [Lewinella sp. 4G2]OAV45992.1 hypothetical protein A3850_019045 [Lewinella sp. 4G2]